MSKFTDGLEKRYVGTWEKPQGEYKDFDAVYIARRKRVAVYAGSFDPVTWGHIWVIKWGMELFDELIVAIGDNPNKNSTFSKDERLAMLKESIEPLGRGFQASGGDVKECIETVGCELKFDCYDNQFLVDYASSQNANFILRGLRNVEEFGYEFSMARFNSSMETGDPLIQTVWAPNTAASSNLSSSFVKSICGPKYWQDRVEGMVPPSVFKRLVKWQKNQNP